MLDSALPDAVFYRVHRFRAVEACALATASGEEKRCEENQDYAQHGSSSPFQRPRAVPGDRVTHLVYDVCTG